jgi:hypothetical protein
MVMGVATGSVRMSAMRVVTMTVVGIVAVVMGMGGGLVRMVMRVVSMRVDLWAARTVVGVALPVLRLSCLCLRRCLLAFTFHH